MYYIHFFIYFFFYLNIYFWVIFPKGSEKKKEDVGKDSKPQFEISAAIVIRECELYQNHMNACGFHLIKTERK